MDEPKTAAQFNAQQTGELRCLDRSLAPTPTVLEEVRRIVDAMPHNGSTTFSTNMNALGHDQSCFKCKLSNALRGGING